MLVRNKDTGKTYEFPKHLMANHPEFEEVVVSVSVPVFKGPESEVESKPAFSASMFRKPEPEVEVEVESEIKAYKVDINSLTYKELKAKAKRLNIDFKGNISKLNLLQMLKVSSNY